MRIGASAALSDTGRKRRGNEDAYVAEAPLFAVADGMGGAQAGELASQLTAEALHQGRADADTAEERIEALVREANRRVFDRASHDASAAGMGTTVTVALVDGGDVVLGHVGDSRAYRIRDGELEQLTRDHSLVQELVRDGKLSPAEAEVHPQRSVITRALGTDPDVDVDVDRHPGRPGDVYLICSDGLTDMLGDEAILRIVLDNRDDLRRAAKALVETANQGGGEDNITVVLFDLTDEPEPSADVTERMPPAAAAAPEDEDTLTEADAVPTVEAPAAVDTMVVPPEQAAALAAAPGPERDRGPSLAGRLLATLLLVALVALVVVVVAWGIAR